MVAWDLESCANEGTIFFMSAGVANQTVVDYGGFDFGQDLMIFGAWVDREADPVMLVFLENFVVWCVEAGGASACVDLSFDGLNLNIGKA